jgi:hypothetical protein
MNLIEAMVAATVLACASGAALQASAEMARSMLRTRELGGGMERLEAELLRAEAQLALAAAAVPPGDPRCADPAGLLAELAAGGPGSVRVIDAGAVSLRVAAAEREGARGAVRARERLLAPAAFGLCAAPAAGGAP